MKANKFYIWVHRIKDDNLKDQFYSDADGPLAFDTFERAYEEVQSLSREFPRTGYQVMQPIGKVFKQNYPR